MRRATESVSAAAVQSYKDWREAALVSCVSFPSCTLGPGHTLLVRCDSVGESVKALELLELVNPVAGVRVSEPAENKRSRRGVVYCITSVRWRRCVLQHPLSRRCPSAAPSQVA